MTATTKRFIIVHDPPEGEQGGLTLEFGPTFISEDSEKVASASGGVLSDDFGDWMNETITLYQYLSSDGYDKTYDSPMYFPCYISNATKNIIKSDGQIATSTAQVYLDGGPIEIDFRDKIEINGFSPQAIKIDKLVDEIGSHYATVIYI